MNINLTPIFQAIIALIAALITYRLIPWIRERTSEAQQNNMRAFIRVLVFAAEEIYGAGTGDKKLDYVREKLAKAGFDVDVAEIKAAVKKYMHPWSGVTYDMADEHKDKPPDEDGEAAADGGGQEGSCGVADDGSDDDCVIDDAATVNGTEN